MIYLFETCWIKKISCAFLSLDIIFEWEFCRFWFYHFWFNSNQQRKKFFSLSLTLQNIHQRKDFFFPLFDTCTQKKNFFFLCLLLITKKRKRYLGFFFLKNQKMTSETKEDIYFTQDNDPFPFKVVISGSVVRVFTRVEECEQNQTWDKERDLPIYHSEPCLTLSHHQKMNVGKEDKKQNSKVISLLFQDQEKKSQFYYIGGHISKVTIPDFDQFHPLLGNSSVNYSYIEGKEFVYLLEEQVKIPVAAVQRHKKENRNPYDLYYSGDISGMDHEPTDYIDP